MSADRRRVKPVWTCAGKAMRRSLLPHAVPKIRLRAAGPFADDTTCATRERFTHLASLTGAYVSAAFDSTGRGRMKHRETER
jgi:hypothetical protein